MKNFKFLFLPVIFLTLIDQIIKVIISVKFLQYDLDLITGFVRFRPILNTKLSWAGNYISFFSNFWVAIFANIFAIFIFISGYLLYLQKAESGKLAAKIIMIFGLAGCLCSLIDKIFWGGSLDFIQIPQLFTFDLKDCFLSIAFMIFVPLGIIHSKKITVKEYFHFCFNRFKL